MPSLPYVIPLTIQYPSGTGLSSVQVALRNQSTDEVLTQTTNSSGEVLFDCSNFPSGYTNGDIVEIVYSNGSLFAEMEYGAIAKTSSFNILEVDEITVE